MDGPAPRGNHGLQERADQLSAELDLRIAAFDMEDRDVRPVDTWLSRLRWRVALWLVTSARRD